VVVHRVREIYQNGRRASLREEEFRKLLRDLGVLSETNKC
jgi:hypothetical protein